MDRFCLGQRHPPTGRYPALTLYALLGLGVFSLSGVISTPGLAQQAQACGPKDKVAEVLQRDHGETVVAEGATDGGALLEVYASPSGSYTITLTRNGTSCLVASGQGWNFVFRQPGRGA